MRSYQLINEDIELQPLTTSSYLKNRTEEDVAHLQKKHNMNVQQLENQLYEYRWTYRWHKFKYDFARWSNLTYPVYSGPKSYIGIQETGKLFIPGFEIPYSVAYPSGIALSSTAAGFFIFSIDSDKMSIRATLEYAARDPLKKRFGDFCTSAWAQPRQTLFNLTKYTFNVIPLTCTNLLGASTNFLGISAFLYNLNPVLWAVSAASVIYFAQTYYDGFSNDEYWDNFNFWWDKNKPWLITQLKDDPAMVLQVLVEGVSAILFKSVGASSVAESFKTEIGFWMPPSWAFVMATYVYMMQYYRSTYDHYLEPKVQAIKHFTDQAMPYSDALQAVKNHEAKIYQESHYGYAIRQEPGILGPLAFRAFIGTYYGANFGPWGMIFGASAMLVWTYRAESSRIRYQQVAKELSGETKAQEVKSGCREIASKKIADTLAISGGLSNMTTSIGQAKDVVGNSPWKMAAYLMVACGATINGMRFAIEKTRATVASLMGSNTRASEVSSTLFNRPQAQPTEKASWFCCGKRR